MVEVIHYQNESVDEQFVDCISQYYDEVRHVLPNLPELVYIYFSDTGIIPETGIGGYAYSNDIITISIDPKFEDTKAQTRSLRPTVFHESFHIYQNFTGTGQQYSPIEDAIYEGMATVFEREYADARQPYGDYSQASEVDLRTWVEKLSDFGDEFLEDKSIYNTWKFYHPELNERWISYRTGTWIVDRVMSDKNLSVLDLSSKKAREVLEMFNKI